MSDGIQLNPGSGGDLSAADDVGGFKIPRIKLVHGADGTNAGDVALTNPLPVSLVGIATSGLLSYFSLDLDESEEEVKGTAGSVYAVWFTNTATATRYLKFYNDTAGNVTVGSTAPIVVIGMPGNTTDDISGSLNAGSNGILFSTAITMAVTTGAATADTGAPGAGDCIVNVFYK